MREENEYVLGTDDHELRRLGFQHQIWAREAAAAWERGGFGPGSHVLDIGCGPGYATLDLARLVGQEGRVVGLDVSPRFVAHLQARAAALGLANVSVEVQDVEALALSPESFDGAYARWVLTFVRSPEAVVAGAAKALKGGGRLVVHDYSLYTGLQLAPEDPAVHRVVEAVVRSWRDRGGDPSVGARIPRMMLDAGLEVVSITPLARIARPGSALWQWPRTFFDNYLPQLVASGYLAEEGRLAFDAVWAERAADPAAWFATPPMVEVVGVRR
ncbi:MAG TPA: methyltransferase domain-containing protein [Longimicrobium sp.]|nr:methyltransferase domain-containing protein [Longimicrobium sp.]